MHIMDDSQNLTLSQRSQTQRVHTACDIVPNKKKSFKKKKRKITVREATSPSWNQKNRTTTEKRPTLSLSDFPGGSDGEESVCNAGDSGSIPGLGKSPGEGNGNTLQYSSLENSCQHTTRCGTQQHQGPAEDSPLEGSAFHGVQFSQGAPMCPSFLPATPLPTHLGPAQPRTLGGPLLKPRSPVPCNLL